MRPGQISRRDRLAEAIRYALSHWDGLCRFLDDGRIELGSSTVERSIRPVVLNQKNGDCIACNRTAFSPLIAVRDTGV